MLVPNMNNIIQQKLSYADRLGFPEQNSPEEEAELKKLKDIEKSVDQAAKKLEKVDGDLAGLKNVSIGCIKSQHVCVIQLCLYLAHGHSLDITFA